MSENIDYNGLILELWNLVEDNLKPKTPRDELCLSILKIFDEYGVELDTLDFEGENKHLQEALETIIEPEDVDDATDTFADYE